MKQVHSPLFRRPVSRVKSGHDYRPTDDEVNTLIARAAEHPLGVEFLREGALDAVSITFQVHAFAVERAREKLR